MSRIKIGLILKNEIDHGIDITRLSRWANRIILNNLRELSDNQEDILYCLARMEDDPQFEYTEDQIKKICQDLILSEEFEEFGHPLVEIKMSAEDLGKGWFYCPICHEAWESGSTYAMVGCPKCENKLHNPMYVPKTENSL